MSQNQFLNGKKHRSMKDISAPAIRYFSKGKEPTMHVSLLFNYEWKNLSSENEMNFYYYRFFLGNWIKGIKECHMALKYPSSESPNTPPSGLLLMRQLWEVIDRYKKNDDDNVIIV